MSEIKEKNEDSEGSMDSEEYNVQNRSMEMCDSDELDGAMNLSDDEGGARNFRSMNKKKKAVNRKRPAR